MKKALLPLFVCFAATLFSFSQDWQWTKSGAGPSLDKITGIATDMTGNVFVCGYFDSLITIDSTRLISAGGTDVFIAKYDADGMLIWARQVGGQNDDYASGISTDITGNCYVTGFFFIQGSVATYGNTTVSEAGDADAFVFKLNASGNLLWLRNGGGKGDDASFGIATDVAGNSYVAGYFTGTATFGTIKVTSIGYSDIFIAKFDAAGNLVWVRTGGGAYQDEPYSICTDAAGNCYVTGLFTGNATFSGTMIQSAGYFDSDAFLLKYNPSGALVFAKRVGGTGNDVGYGISVARNGSIYLCGMYRGTKSFGDNSLTRATGSNGFVAKLDPAGKFVWSRNTDGLGLNEFRKISTDPNGDCLVTGSISDSVAIGSMKLVSSGEKDACVVKYDSKGNLMWVLQGGGENNDEGTCISSDASGNCYLAGQFTNSATFGRVKLSGWGSQDVFISRIK